MRFVSLNSDFKKKFEYQLHATSPQFCMSKPFEAWPKPGPEILGVWRRKFSKAKTNSKRGHVVDYPEFTCCDDDSDDELEVARW